MPLITCPECQKSISDSAFNCPHCGFPLQKPAIPKPVKLVNQNAVKPQKTSSGCQVVIGLFIVILIFAFLGKQCSSNDTKDETVTSDTVIPKISKEDSLKNVAQIDSIAKQKKIDEEKFSKTKAGKIYKKHPEWSKEDCESLANRKIWIGMEYEMVVYLRGKPNHINTSNYGNGSEYQACWDDYDIQFFYFGEDHIITSYN